MWLKENSSKFIRVLRSIVRSPVYILLFAVYPATLMFANNITELQSWMIIRPIIISILVTGIVFGVNCLIFRSSSKAAAFTLVFLVLFFSYGQIYHLQDNAHPIWQSILRHRYLILMAIGILALAGWLVFKNKVDGIIVPLNVVTIALLILPVSRIISYESRKMQTETEMLTIRSSDVPELSLDINENSPDIYYFILDTYTRKDVLLNRFGFDNSAFLDSLTKEGFFVAECSRSNYAQTLLSLNSSLNMSHVKNIQPALDSILGLSQSLNNNIFYSALRSSGYELITFDTGFPPVTITNADRYLTPETEEPLARLLEGFQAFEAMFYDSTAFKLLLDNQGALPGWAREYINSPYSEVRENIFFQLDEVTGLPPAKSPRLIHVHIMAPHPPASFDAEGRPVNGEKYFTLNPNLTQRREFARTAYVDEVKYLNRRLLEIIREIKQKSTRPVVIILQGDHGTYGFGTGDKYDRIKILNAYYFSDQDYAAMYSGISPINTFRIVLNKYFGEDLSLLPDLTYYSAYDARFEYDEISENNPACIN